MPRLTRPSLVLLLTLSVFGCRQEGTEIPSGDADAPTVTNATAPATATDRVLEASAHDEIPVPEEQLAAGVPHLRFNVEIGDAPTRGPADAPVTIVMFSDFECPYCLQANETVADVEREYPGQIRFVYKAFPIDGHPTALLAAMVAHAAEEEGKFWPFYDRIYSGRPLDPGTLVEYAESIGMDLPKLKDEIADFTHAPSVRADMRQARRLDVTSTPTFFVNGRILKGAKPMQVFRHYVDQEISLSRRWIAQGVDKAGVYEHATQHGYTSVAYEEDRNRLDEDSVYPVPLADSPARGPADAPFTVVVFGDFQCPYCARGNQTLERVVEAYADEVRVVFKHYPLPGHPEGALAARGAEYAKSEGKFWEFHDAVYARGARFTGADLVEIAVELGFDEKVFTNAVQGTDNDARIEADMELGRALGVNGTPAFFVNGRPLDGARPDMDFHMLFAEERERVQAKLDSGVAPKALYESLVGL